MRDEEEKRGEEKRERRGRAERKCKETPERSGAQLREEGKRMEEKRGNGRGEIE